MTNAANPRSTTSGDCHHRSVRRVRWGISARVGEKTPVPGRSAVGALTMCLQASPVAGCAIAASATEPSSAPAVTPDTLVIDVPPEVGVVLGVGNRDLLRRLPVTGYPAGEFQLLGVDIEAVDVVDHAPRRRAVPVLRRQRRHAPAQATDQLVQLGKFLGARHQTSWAEGCL